MRAFLFYPDCVQWSNHYFLFHGKVSICGRPHQNGQLPVAFSIFVDKVSAELQSFCHSLVQALISCQLVKDAKFVMHLRKKNEKNLFFSSLTDCLQARHLRSVLH